MVELNENTTICPIYISSQVKYPEEIDVILKGALRESNKTWEMIRDLNSRHVFCDIRKMNLKEDW